MYTERLSIACEKMDARLNVLLYNHSSSSQHGLRVPGGGIYVHFRVADVTNPGGMSCSPYL